MSGTQWFSLAMVLYGSMGLWIAGNKRIAGWWIGLSAQLLWVVFAAITGLWAFYLSAAIYGFTNTRNVIRWRREQRRRLVPAEPMILPGGHVHAYRRPE